MRCEGRATALMSVCCLFCAIHNVQQLNGMTERGSTNQHPTPTCEGGASWKWTVRKLEQGGVRWNGMNGTIRRSDQTL